jgi:hypothetical protein
MAGETVEARFRDEAYQDWACGFYSLCGWAKNHSFPWKSSEQAHRTFGCWKQCQVYREPSYWTERPDPGPGYRLLGKFPGEPKLATDEAWSGTSWLPIAEDNGIQRDCVWYRRRIEPVEPEPKHYVLRVGDSVETPSGHLIKVVSPGVEQIEFKLKAGFTAKLPNGQTITATEKGFEVTQ